MRVTVKTTNFNITEAIATYLEKRLNAVAKHAKRFEAKIGSAPKGRGHEGIVARVELGKTTRHHRKGDVYRAELNLDIPGLGVIRAETETDNLHSAIDLVRDEVTRELKKWKEKNMDKTRSGSRELKRRLRRG